MTGRSVIIYPDELVHYGVQGQKWGVRNYQNEDGSYKPGAEGRYYTPVTTRFGKNGGLSVQSRHKIATKGNEQRFKDSSTGKKIARTGISVATLGLGKTISRFGYRHQVGINKVNKIIGSLGAASVVGGTILTATGNPLGLLLTSGGAQVTGSAIVNRYINMPLNDLIYEKLYSDKQDKIKEERAKNYEQNLKNDRKTNSSSEDNNAEFLKYAQKNRKDYEDQLSGKKSRAEGVTDSDLKRWIKVSKQQEEIYKSGKSTDKFFTDADQSDYYDPQSHRWKNYQLASK